MKLKIETLEATIGELEARLEQIHRSAGHRDLTPLQQRQWDAAETELAECRAELAEAQEIEDRADKVAANRAKWGCNQLGTPTSSSDVRRMPDGDVRSQALRLLDDAKRTKHLDARQGDHLDALLRSTARESDGGIVAKLLVMTESGAYRSAFQRVMLDPHPVLSGAEADALRQVAEFRAASLSDASGGYSIPGLIDPTLILAGQQSANPFWRIGSVRTITTNTWKGVSTAGASWSWDAEGEEVSDDAPTLAQPEATVFTARGFIPYSLEIGQDYPSFASDMAMLLSEGYAELTAEAFATGGGTTSPKGIITALDANTYCEVAVVTAGEFTAADIDKVWTQLPDRAKGNAVWVMNSQVASHIAAWGDAYGGRTADLSGVPLTLRGRPILESSYFPTWSATTGAFNVLVVGDFSKFVIAQRAGLAVEPIPHLFGTTNQRPTGQRGMFAWARVGSTAADELAFRLLQNGS